MKFARRKVAAVAVGMTLSAASQHVYAQTDETVDLSNRVYGGILGSYIDTDRALKNVKHGTGGLLYYGHELGESNLFVEGSLFTQDDETGRADLTDFYRHGGGLDLVYAGHERTRTSFFILAGAGAEYYDVVPDKYDKFSGYVDAGGGVVTAPLIYDLRIRAEARFVHDLYGNGKNDFQYSIGLELPLLAPTKTHYVPVPTAEPVAVVPPTVITETTVIKEQVADTDGDGVPDEFDKCPNTPKGLPVDGVGCGLAQVITLTGVTFDTNKSILTAASRQILEETAIKVKPFGSVDMEIEGHTDNVGSDVANDKLSKARAESVRKFLIEQGVPGDHLTARGFGKRVPVADNKTAEGRALNRRVELHIGGETSVTVPVNADGSVVKGDAPTPVPQQ